MELLAVFARQAATAIEASKVQRDTGRLLREVLRQVGEGELSEDQVEGLAEVRHGRTGSRRGGPLLAPGRPGQPDARHE